MPVELLKLGGSYGEAASIEAQIRIHPSEIAPITIPRGRRVKYIRWQLR